MISQHHLHKMCIIMYLWCLHNSHSAWDCISAFPVPFIFFFPHSSSNIKKKKCIKYKLSILCFKIIPNQVTSTSQTFTFTLLPGSSDLLLIQVLRIPSVRTVVSTCSLTNLKLLGPPCFKSSVKTSLFSKQLLLLWKTFVSVPVYMCVVLDLCCLCRCTVCVCMCVCELCMCVCELCVHELCVCVCKLCIVWTLCVCVQLVKCLGLRVIEAKCLWSKRKVTPTEVHVSVKRR